ncbi:MAG TPA: hypothetical protein VFM14_07430 [Gemmatimonadales bacterium]|nr:hypothetical protein [Gemmatimonadales bacterium]
MTGHLAIRPSSMLRTAIWAAALVMAAPAAAQNEATLKSHFEGRMVVVRMDLPATDDGVDVYPAATPPIDFPRYQSRIKQYGTAIREGERAMVTKVKVKGNLIEFQLGGGYGTLGDQTDPSVGYTPVPKTERERNLERDVKNVRDPVVKERMEDELDYLRAHREREDRRNRALMAEATERRRASIQERRLAGGARFNLRWRDGVPPSALTPDAVESALAKYVDFGGEPAQPEPPPLALGLKKGLAAEDVEAMLGDPIDTTERMEGSLRVQTRTFERGGERVLAEFVEGVLIRYQVRSN